MKPMTLLFAGIFMILLLTENKALAQPNAWINEIHYDNTGTDSGEFIEVVIENAGTYALSDFQLDLYNGNDGAVYNTKTLDQFTVGATTNSFTIYTFSYPTNGIQNGAPDGMALSYQGSLIAGQFLSYEGTFTAVGGPANGILSVDIGVSEPGSDPAGLSLQLAGAGGTYASFTWQSPATATAGAVNNNQTIGGGGGIPTRLAITLVNGGNSPTVNQPFPVVVQSQDDSSIPQNVAIDVNVSLSLATGSGTLGGTLTGTILAGTNAVTISGITYSVAETGVSITVSDISANLDPGTSALFEVIPAPTQVTNLAQLRSGTLGNNYTVTGEVILTFRQTFRNQKYIEDATAAILIDDPSGVITTNYTVGDGITGITGTLSEFGTMLQFIPLEDPGVPSSTGNVITPQVITLTDLTANFESYESELVQVNNVTFAAGGGTFANGVVYAMTDAGGSFNFRTTFYDVNYIGTTIPLNANIVCLPNARAEGNFVTSRNLADIQVLGLPVIQKAFSLSSTSLDVYYNLPPGAVDPGDFYLTGTTTISFAGATIDGANPNLVHLTGANPAMASDLVLDEIFDDAYGSSLQLYAGISPISQTNTTNLGGTMTDGYYATFSGIVSANDGANSVWVSDGAGAYQGVLVYDGLFDGLVATGDEITFAGIRSPFNNLTEIVSPELIQVISTGNMPFGPAAIDGSEIATTNPVNTNPAESWEGQLVTIGDFTVDSISFTGGNFACSWEGESTYIFYVGNNAGSFSLTVGNSYTFITGVVDWYWSGTYYRINPRNQDDIGGGVIPQIPAIMITEVMQNPNFVSDALGEWFEVFNNSANPVDMNGWVMKDLGTNTHTIGASVIVPPFGFAVLGTNADPLANGGYTVNYVYPSSFALGNADDEIILYLPGGTQEVDRVEWDGGSVWPDPTGASMIFTGIPEDNNNNGRLWATAVSVEGSYTNPTGDFGSPGTNGADQVLTEGFSLDIRALLEACYNPSNDSMNNYFRTNLQLPTQQPFNPVLPYYGNNDPVWSYTGTEVSPYLSPNSTDWILIELRNGQAASGVVSRFPALVEVDGQVCSYNGSARLSVKNTFPSGLYIAILHRNHLGIINATGLIPAAGSVFTYDFTSGSGQVLNGTAGYKELEPGIWGMVAGDMNGDGQINDADLNNAWAGEAGSSGIYRGTNLFIDNQIDNQDKNEYWTPNYGKISQIPW